MNLTTLLPGLMQLLTGGGGAQQGGAPPPMQSAPPQPQQAAPAPQGQPAQLQQAPQQAPPQMPMQGGQQGWPPPDMVQALMQRAQSMMTNPNSQMVPPQQSGIIDPAAHPFIAALIKGLSGAASGYGMTAMAPQERLQRQELENQKAQTLASLAANQEYRQGELGYRNQMASAATQNANTKESAQDTNAQYKQFQEQNAQDKLDMTKELGMARIDIQQGRLDQGLTRIKNQADQFEDKFELAIKNYGLEAAKTQMMGQGLAIKQQLANVAQTALSQKGTEAGSAVVTKLQQMQMEHPILSEVFGFDMSDIMGSAQPTPVPGAGNVGVPTAPAGGPTPATGKPAASPKASGGVTITHVWTPNGGIQPVPVGGTK